MANNPARLFLTIPSPGKPDTGYEVDYLHPAPEAALVAWKLTKDDGTAHEAALTEHGFNCSCPDFIFRKDHRDPLGCKHLRALRALGLFGRRNLPREP